MPKQTRRFLLAWFAALVLELLLFAFIVRPANQELARRTKSLAVLERALAQVARDEIPTRVQVQQLEQQREFEARGMLRALIELAARDQQTLEARVPGLGEDAASIQPWFHTHWLELEQRMAIGAPPYQRLRVQEIQTPTLPRLPEEVPDFYRRWWVQRMFLDQVIAAARHTRVWQLEKLAVGESDNFGWPEDVVHQRIPVSATLKLPLVELSALLEKAVNTAFVLQIGRLEIRQSLEVASAPDDGGRIDRPRVRVELRLDVADLNQDRLMRQCRWLRPLIGGREGMTAFVDQLASDQSFMPGYAGRENYLAQLLAALLG